jgi:hypothetical protein
MSPLTPSYTLILLFLTGLTHAAIVCLTCSSCVGKILQMFHTDVAKVDLVLRMCLTRVVSVLSECCIFHREICMFQSIWNIYCDVFSPHVSMMIINIFNIFLMLLILIFDVWVLSFDVVDNVSRCYGCVGTVGTFILLNKLEKKPILYHNRAQTARVLFSVLSPIALPIRCLAPRSCRVFPGLPCFCVVREGPGGACLIRGLPRQSEVSNAAGVRRQRNRRHQGVSSPPSPIPTPSISLDVCMNVLGNGASGRGEPSSWEGSCALDGMVWLG